MTRHGRVIAWVVLAGCAAARAAGADDRGPSFFGGAEFLPDPLAGIERKVVCLPAVSLAVPPQLDGKMGDFVWQDAQRLSGWMDYTLGREPRFPVQAWVARGEDALYVATRVQYPVPGNLPAVAQSMGQPGFYLRHLFNPHPEQWKRTEFHVRGSGPDWLDGGVSSNTAFLRDYLVPKSIPPVPGAAVCRRNGEWLVTEAIIPYAILGVDPPARGAEWAFDLECGCSEMVPIPGSDQFQAMPRLAAWGGNYRVSHCQVEKWGRLFFGSEEERASAALPPVVRVYTDRDRYADADEAGEAYVEILAGSDPLETLSLDLAVAAASGPGVAALACGPARTGAVGVPLSPGSLPHGAYALVARVSKDGRLLGEGRRPFERYAGDPAPKLKAGEMRLKLFNDPRLGEVTLPVSTGVPLPKGMAPATAGFRVEKASGDPWKPVWRPVPAQFDVRSRWYREGSIKWMGVSFDAEYRQGWPAEYRVVWGAAGPARDADKPLMDVEKPLTIEEDDDAFLVVTGPARFRISKAAFNLFDAAWLDVNRNGRFEDGERIVQANPASGLWYENQSKRRLNAAHAGTSLRVAEWGPMRAVMVAEGWYESGGTRECRHQTRLFFSRGSPTVKIKHTWINTADSRNTRVRDISLRVGVPDVKDYAFGSEDGSLIGGDSLGKGVYQVQLRSDRFVVEGAGRDAAEGMRMGGWVYAGTGRGGVSVAGRDLWKLFPKELSVSRDGVALHLWPEHGREAFSREEQASIPGVIKLLSAHQGRELDFQLPASGYEFLGRRWDEEWKAEGPDRAKSFGPFAFWKAVRGSQANAQGVAVSVEADLTLHAPGEGPAAARRRAAILAVNPHGIADPAWTRATGALGPLHEKDPGRFGSVERLMEDVFDRAFIRQTEELDDYGMFNWPDYHTYAYDAWRPSARAVHRCWVNSHYQEPRLCWLMYLRSGEGKYWRYAGERCRHAMDVDAVNYGENPPIAPYHQAGSTYHCKGVLHWGGNGGVSGHFVNYDFMLLDYYLTGDPRGLDFTRMWAEEIEKNVYVGEQERETAGALSEAIEVYQQLRDPRLLKLITWDRDALLSAPFELFLAAPDFNRMLWWRMHAFTADPRVRDRIVEQWGDGNKAKPWDLGYGLLRSMAFDFTGDRRILYGEGIDAGTAARLFTPRYTIAHPVAYTLESTIYLMSAFERIGGDGDLMLPSLNKDAFDRFWKDDREQWRSEGKTVWGREP